MVNEFEMKTPVNQKRRSMLLGAALLSLLHRLPAHATPLDAATAMRAISGTTRTQAGRVRLDIPPLVENGNLVVMRVSVQSPMTDSDYVKAVHVIAEANPLPNVFSAYLGPRAGRAEMSFRARLATTQRVWALAQMSDGSVWTGYADVLVTLAACTESP